jgi:hypothetical protein
MRINSNAHACSLENDAYSLRERAYRATTLLEEYSSFVRGLSWEIARKSLEAKILRARLLVSNQCLHPKQKLIHLLLQVNQ